MKTLLVVIMLFGCMSLAKAESDWTKTDTALQVTYTTLHVLDWGTSLDIANHKGMYETNFIMGKHPSRSTINTYFATTLALHTLVTYLLPQGVVRSAWQAVSIGVELGYVYSNFSIGLKTAF